MARRVNKKCQHCATLSLEDAIALHGPADDTETLPDVKAVELHGCKGEQCWNPATCHRKRSHYRKRDDNNRTRRRMYRHSKSEEESEPRVKVAAADPDSYYELLPQPTTAYAAVLVLYRSKKDSPVHAIAAEIWQGNTKVLNIKAIHCAGMRGNEVAEYIQQLLTKLHEQFGVSRFEAEPKALPVHECPLVPCPLKIDAAVSSITAIL